MLLGGSPLDWTITPLEALARWPAHQPVALLHSGRLHEQWARYSILALPEAAYCQQPPHLGGHSRWVGSVPPALTQIHSQDALADLADIAAADDALYIGYVGYDIARQIENLPSRAAADRDWPAVQMQRCPGWLVYDNLQKQWYACGSYHAGNLPQLADAPAPPQPFAASQPESNFTRDAYQAMVARGKDYIAAGDVFQVNLTQRFTADFTGSPRDLFAALAQASPAWYGAYIELLPVSPDQPRRVIASTSPELFLQVDAQGQVITRPIKGTRPASASPDELLASEKDAAELHMIVDLLRNDLGRVCKFSSVKVQQQRTIESHPTVHHGVATVAGTLRADQSLADLLRATLPGGSITGAPKVRAMQIIDELETVRRGPYCGAIGYIHRNTAALNIAIRTILLEMHPTQNQGRLDFAVGGGIVADSDPASEYQESLDKAAAIIAALQSGNTAPPPNTK